MMMMMMMMINLNMNMNMNYDHDQEDGHESWFSRCVRVSKRNHREQDQRSTKDPARPDLGGDRPIDMASDEASMAGSPAMDDGALEWVLFQLTKWTLQQKNIGRAGKRWYKYIKSINISQSQNWSSHVHGFFGCKNPFLSQRETAAGGSNCSWSPTTAASQGQLHLVEVFFSTYGCTPNGFADHYPYEKWLFHWEYTLFSDTPRVCLKMLCTPINPMVLLIIKSQWKMAISLGIYPIFRHTHIWCILIPKNLPSNFDQIWSSLPWGRRRTADQHPETADRVRPTKGRRLMGYLPYLPHNL